jgi:hypothetical protein
MGEFFESLYQVAGLFHVGFCKYLTGTVAILVGDLSPRQGVVWVARGGAGTLFQDAPTFKVDANDAEEQIFGVSLGFVVRMHNADLALNMLHLIRCEGVGLYEPRHRIQGTMGITATGVEFEADAIRHHGRAGPTLRHPPPPGDLPGQRRPSQ